MNLNQSPFFSVVIPCYNIVDIIGPTLETLINQTFTDFEIIFVNDGSNDHTLNTLTDFQLKINNQVTIINQENKGLGAARNSGIKISNGKYIALLDADDTWTNNKLSVLFEFINLNNKFELYCHNEFTVTQNSNFIKNNIYGPFTSFEDLFYKGNCLSPSAVVLNKNVFNIVGYFSEDRDFHGVEDYDFWLRVSLKKLNISYLSDYLGYYVIHNSNMSTSLNFFDNEEKLLLTYIIRFNSDLLNNKKMIKKRLLFFYSSKLYHYIREGNYRYLTNYFKDSFKILLYFDEFLLNKKLILSEKRF
jgi:glycosyltransferase involved in cell wall biosynthesis